MSIYISDECGVTFDGDYHLCVEHPGDSSLLCCEECSVELEEAADMEKEFKRMKSEYDREIISGLKRK